MSKTLRVLSKQEFNSDTSTIEHIQTGTFQRIADAVEKTAERITWLIDENIGLKNRIIKLENQNRGLRGKITRMKRKAARDANE